MLRYGLLTMTKLHVAELLMGIKGTGKVQKQKVAKSQIVLLLLLLVLLVKNLCTTITQS